MEEIEVELNKGEKVRFVDIPLLTEKEIHKKTEPVEKKSPWWKWPVVGGGVALLVVGGVIVFSWFSGRADLEIRAPRTAQPKERLTPTPETASVSGVLAAVPYVNSDQGFSIRPPEGWKTDDSGRQNTAVIFLSPKTTVVEKIVYVASISVETKEAANILLEDQVKEVKERMKTDFPDMVVEDEIQTYLQSRPYFMYGGSYTSGGMRMKRKGLLTIYKGRAYAISAAGPESDWLENEAVILASMFSFKIL